MNIAESQNVSIDPLARTIGVICYMWSVQKIIAADLLAKESVE